MEKDKNKKGQDRLQTTNDNGNNTKGQSISKNSEESNDQEFMELDGVEFCDSFSDLDMDFNENLHIQLLKLSNEESELEFADKNPLLISIVLGSVFKNLDVSSLKKCRGICRLWNMIATPYLSDKVVVNLVCKDSLMRFVNTFQRETSLAKPFPKRFSFSFYYDIIEQIYDTNMNNFYKAFGNQIQVLTIKQNSPIGDGVLYVILKDFLPNLKTLNLSKLPSLKPSPFLTAEQEEQNYCFPNIKKIGLGESPWSGQTINEYVIGEMEGNMKTALLRLLSYVPNLTTLSGPKPPKLESAAGIMLVSKVVLNTLIETSNDNLMRLEKLVMPLWLCEEKLEQLIEKPFVFGLKEVHFNFVYGCKTTEIKRLLVKLAPSIKILDITFASNGQHPENALPHNMHNLKHLKLTNYNWPLNLNTLLQLKSLVLTATFPHGILPELNFEHNLNSLKLEQTKFPMLEKELIRKFIIAFPRLQLFHCSGLDDDDLRKIYNGLPYLEDFSCVNGEFTDAGITGVSAEICQDLLETMRYERTNSDGLRTDLFIGNLINLKKLRLESPFISNASLPLGILKCKRLVEVCLTSDKISNTAVKIVAEKFPNSLNELNLTGCRNVDKLAPDFASVRVPPLKLLTMVRVRVMEEFDESEELNLYSPRLS